MSLVITAVLTVLFSFTQPQYSPTPTAYDSADSYEIYSVLMPREQSWRFATGTLVIQQETVPSKVAAGGCFTEEANEKFKEAFANYNTANERRWVLQRRFSIEKPYELVGAERIKKLTATQDWKDFKAEYPGSGGVFTMSAVGFNSDMTLAVVHTGSYCPGLCGRWSVHLMQKLDGKWREAGGSRCVAMS